MTDCVACASRPRKGSSELCGGCFARLRAELATVQWAHEWLGAAITAPTPAWKPGALHRPGESNPPYRVDYTDARTDIHAKLASWATMIGEEHFPPLAGPLDDTVPGICTWLRARLPWVSDQPWVDAFLAELVELRQSAYRLAPWDRIRTDLPLPCPGDGCRSIDPNGLLTLSIYGGDDAVICRNKLCGLVMTAYEYKKAVAEWMTRRHQELAEKTLREAAANETAA